MENEQPSPPNPPVPEQTYNQPPAPPEPAYSPPQVVASPDFSPQLADAPAPLTTTPDFAGNDLPPAATDLQSQPVVRVLSPRGVEYVFLTIALFAAAIGLAGALLSLVNGQSSFDVLAFPVASLIVSLPVFGLLFLRLKKSELENPNLRYEASKRRSTQFTQITTFVISFFTIIGFVTTLFAKMAGGYHGSIGKVLLDVLIVLLVAGGILAYYWHDEHRLG